MITLDKRSAKRLAQAAPKIVRQDHETGTSIPDEKVVTYAEMVEELGQTSRWFADQIADKVTISTLYRVTFEFQVKGN